MKTLETARLLLTPWREEDAEALYALASDPDIGPMCGWEPHRSVEDSRRIIRDVFSAPEVCAILSRESGTLLGAVGLQPPSEMFPELPATRQRELGYWLGRAYWGHGIMLEAVQALLRYGFGELKLEAVWCSHYDWNRQSRRVIEKCGFRYQFTKKTTNVMNATHETVFYALKREEWDSLHGKKEFVLQSTSFRIRTLKANLRKSAPDSSPISIR